jgi:hypothetical protein
MRLPHLKISMHWLMLVVALAAVNFAILRGVSNGRIDIGIAFVTLPMASILLLAVPRAWGGNATRRFWIGFEMAGWSMALLFGYLSHSKGSDFYSAANSVYPWHTIRNWHIRFLYVMSIDFIVYTPPQVVVAWLVGLVVAKYQSWLEPVPSDGPP